MEDLSLALERVGVVGVAAALAEELAAAPARERVERRVAGERVVEEEEGESPFWPWPLEEEELEPLTAVAAAAAGREQSFLATGSGERGGGERLLDEGAKGRLRPYFLRVSGKRSG